MPIRGPAFAFCDGGIAKAITPGEYHSIKLMFEEYKATKNHSYGSGYNACVDPCWAFRMETDYGGLARILFEVGPAMRFVLA